MGENVCDCTCEESAELLGWPRAQDGRSRPLSLSVKLSQFHGLNKIIKIKIPVPSVLYIFDIEGEREPRSRKKTKRS